MRGVFYFCLFIVLKKGGNKGVWVMDEVMNDGLFLLGGVLGFCVSFFLFGCIIRVYVLLLLLFLLWTVCGGSGLGEWSSDFG